MHRGKEMAQVQVFPASISSTSTTETHLGRQITSHRDMSTVRANFESRRNRVRHDVILLVIQRDGGTVRVRVGSGRAVRGDKMVVVNVVAIHHNLVALVRCVI
jgi:hypothetical protein